MCVYIAVHVLTDKHGDEDMKLTAFSGLLPINWNIWSNRFDLSAAIGTSSNDCLPRNVQLLDRLHACYMQVTCMSHASHMYVHLLT